MASKIPSISLSAASIGSLAGFLFGYSTSIVSGALFYIAHEFALSTFEQEQVVSMLLLGALLGALIAGFIADRFGRRRALVVVALTFLVGSIILLASMGYAWLLSGRAIAGIGVGAGSVIVPLYISEMSPPTRRGMLVSINQLAITFGILCAYLINNFLAHSENWRLMFGFGCIPALILLVGLLFLPETPAWLLTHGRPDKARHILSQFRENDDVDPTLSKMSSLTQMEKLHIAIFPLIVGIFISVFQQITGINAVFYYAANIFRTVGFGSDIGAINATIALGGVNMVVTFISMFLIDRIGRKPLLIIGTALMIASLLTLSGAYLLKMDSLSVIALITLLGFVAGFAIGLGPVTWLIIAEVYPIRARGRAMGFAILANWACNYLVAVSFLSLIFELGVGYIFLIFGGISIVALIFICTCVPETKGKTLEEIEGFWQK